MCWEAQEKLNLNLGRVQPDQKPLTLWAVFFISFYSKVVKRYNQIGGFDTDYRPLTTVRKSVAE
jgi:hypothetical protein